MALIIGSSRGERLVGTQRGDAIDGQGGDDRIFGLGGGDILVGGPGANLLDGGAGRDAVTSLAGVEDEKPVPLFTGPPLEVDLARRVAVVGGETTRLVNVEDAYGSEGDDRLSGDDGPNRLFGSYGDDVLLGRGGRDFLESGLDGGGEGVNVLRGGRGDDVLNMTAYDNSQAFGGVGADRFQIDVVVSGDASDPFFTIRDFDREEGDVIDLVPDFLPDLEFAGEGRLEANGTPEMGFRYTGGNTLVEYEIQDDDRFQETNQFLISGRVELTADDFALF